MPKKKRADTSVQLKKGAFLAAFVTTGTISGAAAAAQIGRTSHYEWLEKDKQYVEAFADAKVEATDVLEQEARRRAVEGIHEPVIYQGELQGVWVNKEGETVTKGTRGATLIPLTVRKYSDTLLIFLLKGALPDKYRERREITGADGGPLAIKVRGPTD